MRTDKMVSQQHVDRNGNITDPYVLQYCSIQIMKYSDMLNRVAIADWNIHQVVAYIRQGTTGICFSDYARKYHDKMVIEGHARNARNYELAYQNLERYAGTTKVMFSHLTSGFITNWINSLSGTARAKELYPVCVRQIYKQALLEYNDYDQGIMKIANNPWPKVKIPKSDTPEKRAITMEECRAFFSAPLPESDWKYPLQELGRDVAMMILCLAGINTVDLYFLQKKNYHDDIIGYNRRKTRKARADKAWFEIRVPDILKPTIEKYLDRTDSEYLLNFHRRHSSYDSFNANVNIGIRQICEKVLNLQKEDYYSAYTFRHTWATVAQNECSASLSDVDFGLNHAHKTRLARTYVKVDFTPAWILNEEVVEKIFFTEEVSSANKNEKKEKDFFRFSAKMMIKASLYFRGKSLVSFEDIGFNNVDEVIAHLMRGKPETIPPRSMVIARVEIVEKGLKQDYMRMT